MPEQREIYSGHADRYQALVSREDYQGNIPGALAELVTLDGKHIVELGAGTGRLSRLLTTLGGRVSAFDSAWHMLRLAATQHKYLDLAVADNRRLPIPNDVADIAIAGWSICYLVVWNPETWETQLDRGLEEMKRVVRSGGQVIILETLGTGVEQPTAPDNLVPYYEALESNGFRSTWIRTDYRFDSLHEAEDLVRFFFGDTLAKRVVDEDLIVLPECTGIWWIDTTEG